MADLDQFRLEVRQWLEDNCPASQRLPITREEQVWAGKNKQFPSDDAKLWFERMREAYTVLWWVPQGHRPDTAEAKHHLQLLRDRGPGPEAFDFKHPFPAPEA